jgi:lipopolysaccharide heptosyltransferase III
LSLNDPAGRPGGLPGLEPGARILILRLRSLGDLVLTTPALAALHDWRRDLRLAVLVEPAFRAVFEGHPAVEETICAGGFAGTVGELRRRRFSIVFNQHGGPRSAFLSAAAGAPVRVAWAGSQFSFLYDVLVPGPETFYGPRPVHSVEHRITQFYWLGLPRGPIPPTKVYPQPDAVEAAERKLGERGVAPGRPYALVRPGATEPARRWDLEKFARLAEWLSERHGLIPVMDFGPGESELFLQAQKALRSPAVLVGGLDLRELIAMIAGARLFVGNDSGPTHVAAAVGCPVVAIFGSSSPAIWRPWTGAYRVVEDAARGVISIPEGRVREACQALLAETDEAAPGLHDSLRKQS